MKKVIEKKEQRERKEDSSSNLYTSISTLTEYLDTLSQLKSGSKNRNKKYNLLNKTRQKFNLLRNHTMEFR